MVPPELLQNNEHFFEKALDNEKMFVYNYLIKRTNIHKEMIIYENKNSR